jgi:enoyl-CoA hydratase/carnithine racemase
MSFETIILKKEGHIATLILNRPEKLNALNDKMAEEIYVGLNDVDGDENVRVMVTTGAGRAFSAGGDQKPAEGESAGGDLRKLSPRAIIQRVRYLAEKTLLRLRRMQIPTIAMVNGYAIGFGLDWALGCDLRIGSENAKFRYGYTGFALTSNSGGIWLLAQAVGATKAAELMFIDEFVHAEEARRIGLLTRLVPHAELERETMALANKISQGPPIALQWDKFLLYSGLHEDMETAINLHNLSKPPTVLSKDHGKAAAAFIEKRRPSF